MNDLDFPPEEIPEENNQAMAVANGLAALIVACVPLAVFVLTPDDGPRGAWAFADARNWLALRWFCLASVIALMPALLLLRRARDRARGWPARMVAAIALAATMPLIPGTMMQAAWWIAG